MTLPSARYTYQASERGMSHLLDQVNEFCLKYPEYRLLQVTETFGLTYAILTTDPN